MDWIFDHFQIVVVLAIIVGSLFKQFLDSKTAERENREDPGDVFSPDEDWKPVQRPQPSPSVPPPLARTSPPPLARVSIPPKAAAESDTVLKRQLDMQERLRQIKEAKVPNLGSKSSGHGSKRTKSQAEAKLPLRGALRSRGEIRRAFVMREILGPPVGLK